MQLRPYQQAAIEAVYDHLRTRDDHPVVVSPTGSGKSILIAKLVADAVTQWAGRVLVLAHVKELLEQNADKIRRLCPGIDIGVYSAGLKSRDTENAVIVAGIQSVHKRACELGRFDLIVVDEVHRIPMKGDGQYRRFLEDATVINPHVRVIGLTATPYRLDGGMICRPDSILNEVCFEIGIKEMIADGYLTPLRSKGGRTEADFDDLHIRGGEFVASEMEAMMDQAHLVRSACREIVELTQDRNAVLIFCAGVDHCRHVAAEMERLTDQECAVVVGDTPSDERATILARFKGETVAKGLFETHPPLKYLANVGVLTTGFDATNVDCVVLLRPTASPGLYVQICGRGTRLHPGKDDCLILDFGGNVLRHGPVDAVEPRCKDDDEDGKPPVKACPLCMELIAPACRTCPECGFEFPATEVETWHEETASDAGILSGQVEDHVCDVDSVSYEVHVKRGALPGDPRTMRIDYHLGLNRVSEWVCPEHSGFARGKFVAWWLERCALPPPTNADEAVFLANDGALAEPTEITIRTTVGERFDRIVSPVLGPKPEYSPEPGWHDDDDNQYVPVGAGVDDDEIPF